MGRPGTPLEVEKNENSCSKMDRLFYFINLIKTLRNTQLLFCVLTVNF